GRRRGHVHRPRLLALLAPLLPPLVAILAPIVPAVVAAIIPPVAPAGGRRGRDVPHTHAHAARRGPDGPRGVAPAEVAGAHRHRRDGPADGGRHVGDGRAHVEGPPVVAAPRADRRGGAEGDPDALGRQHDRRQPQGDEVRLVHEAPAGAAHRLDPLHALGVHRRPAHVAGALAPLDPRRGPLATRPPQPAQAGAV